MNKNTLTISPADYEEMKAKGIDDESLLKPGKYTLNRRSKIAAHADLQPSNTQVELQIKFDLDVFEYFQQLTGAEDADALQICVNKHLRTLMEEELNLKEVEKRLLNDKQFISAIAEEIKNAA